MAGSSSPRSSAGTGVPRTSSASAGGSGSAQHVNPSSMYVGLYHPSSSQYYHDFSETEEYKAALEKYKDHPLYSNLVNMPGLRGSYSPGLGERVAASWGVDTSGYQNWYSSAYTAFQQNLSNVIQQMEAATYDSVQESVKREAAAGINSALNGGPAAGFGVEDEEHPGVIPDPAEAAAAGSAPVRGAVDVLSSGLTFFLSTGLQMANAFQDLRSKSLRNSLDRLDVRSGSRSAVLDQALDNLRSNFPDMEELDKLLREDPSAASPDFLESLVESMALGSADFGDRTLNKEARRYLNVFKGDNLRFRKAAYSELRSYYQEKYGAASEAAKPGFRKDDSDFNTMIEDVSSRFYKYFDQYVEWDARIRSAEATLSGVEAARASATGTREHISREAKVKEAQEELALVQTQMQQAESALWKEIDDSLKGSDKWYAPILRSLVPIARSAMHQGLSTFIDRSIPGRMPRGRRSTETFGPGGELLGGSVTSIR